MPPETSSTFAFRVRGVRGAIVWGFHTAAALGPWRVSRERMVGSPVDTGWQLTATIVRADAFQCARRPLYFTAAHDKGSWCWPVETLHIHGGRLTARLLNPEQ